MKSDDDATTSSRDLEHRRWLIGIGVSVLFGIFGVVMALLNFYGRTKPVAPAAPTAVAPERAASPPGRGHGKGKDRE